MDNSLSPKLTFIRNTDNRKKDILVLGEDPTNGLDNTIITAEAKYCLNITKSRKKICKSTLQCKEKFFMYANGVEIYHFKAKGSEMKPYQYIWEIFQNILQLRTRKNGLNRCVGRFSFDYDITNMNIF